MELNPQQQVAVELSGQHALVLAGAGTGKTATIIGRAAWLLRGEVPARRILLLTFTRRAAREMVARLERDLGPAARGVVAGTFHHFCLLTMRRQAKAFGLVDATVIDRDDQLQLVRLARAGVRRKGEQFPQAAGILGAISFARNTNAPLAVYLAKHSDWDEDTTQRVLQVAKEYRQRKQQRGYLDFDDLLHRFAAVLHKDPAVRRRVAGAYDHVLVDEMQDTNPLQWLILDALRSSACLFCVGDDAQSIYAFRGADFRNVHAFGERVPGAATLKLERNYRSTQPILDLANWLLDGSSLAYGKRLVSHRGPGEKPRLLDFDDELAEADWIATDLIERHERGAPWRHHMIITRTAWAARSLEAALVQREVPYRFVGGTQLFQAAHVKDLLALVRAGLSHRDELAWVRYLTLWPGIGDVRAARTIDGLLPCPDLPGALDALRASWRGDERVHQGPRQVWLGKGQPAQVISGATRFLEPLLERRYDNWRDRKRDLTLLAKLAERHRSLPAFLEAYALDPISSTEASRLESDDAVTLITAHSAKGTEAPVCYLLRVEPGLYPHARSLGDLEQEEEERRVLYVAMTRAMDHLILTRSSRLGGHRVFWGGAAGQHAPGGSAYLLEDLPDELIERGEVSLDPWDDDEIIIPHS
jgi:DNA helicase-2/ATP-dependent DNA helicase PcrA